MNLFAALLLAHLISDFPLQTNRIFRMKIEGHLGLALHTAIHILVTAILLKHFWRYWPILLFLGVMHYLTDWIKVKYSGKSLTPGFVLDQIAHIMVLILIVIAAPQMTAVLPLWFLVPAIMLASVPAFLTFTYIWATDRCQIERQPAEHVTWASTKLLPLSQKAGWIIVITLTTTAIIITG